MAKQVGIWLDFKEAYIIELSNEEASVDHLPSEVEDYHVVGGSRTKQPWGPMDKTSDTKYLGRRATQLKHYYGQVMEKVSDADELLIFGPAEAKKGLEKAIRNTKSFRPQLRHIETADSMSQNQMVARVRDFFSSN